MNFTDFLSAADTILQQALGSAGFRQENAETWIRQNGDELNVVWLQKHSSKPSFCVNLGVHYAFLPVVGTEIPIIGGRIEQPDCEIKLRLTSDPLVKDQWWLIAPENANEVGQLLVIRGLPIFDAYRLDGSISVIDPKDVEIGNPNLLSSLTKVRACLLLARLHERCGNREKCIEAATAGIKLAGRAVGPKVALKDILKRCEIAA